jgi:hypothetical protein
MTYGRGSAGQRTVFFGRRRVQLDRARRERVLDRLLHLHH